MNEESDNENENRQSKRRRLNEEDLLRQSERRKWVENRETILFNYLQYSYYGKSVCIIINHFNNIFFELFKNYYMSPFITECDSGI